jgi:hypothetical protein
VPTFVETEAAAGAIHPDPNASPMSVEKIGNRETTMKITYLALIAGP